MKSGRQRMLLSIMGSSCFMVAAAAVIQPSRTPGSPKFFENELIQKQEARSDAVLNTEFHCGISPSYTSSSYTQSKMTVAPDRRTPSIRRTNWLVCICPPLGLCGVLTIMIDDGPSEAKSSSVSQVPESSMP